MRCSPTRSEEWLWRRLSGSKTGFAFRRQLVIGEHIAFWLALGLILAFIPYFPYSKHIHLFFAPLNLLLKP